MAARSPAAEEHEYTATLRVFSEKLSRRQLVAALGDTTEGHDLGDPVSKARPDGPKRAQALWKLTSSVGRTRPLDEHVVELVEFVERHAAAVEAVREHVDMSIFCGVFTAEDAQGGFAFDSELLRRLGEHRLPVLFDVY